MELREVDVQWSGLNAAAVSTLGWEYITRVQVVDFTDNNLTT